MSRWTSYSIAAISVFVFAISHRHATAQTLDEVMGITPTVEAPPVAEPLAFDQVTPVSHACDDGGGGCDSCGRCLDRWYIGLSGGWQEREDVHEVDDARTFIIFDSGFLVNAQLGYRFDLFRVEAEMSFMNNDVQRAGALGFDTPATGNVNLRAYMFNIYHDFNLFDWMWEPYVGAGIGIYQSELNSLYPDFFSGFGPPQDGFPVNTTSNMPLAYQFRAGMSRPVGQRTEFLVGYRYFKGEELTFASIPFASPAAPTFHPDGAAIHNLEVGLRVRF
jgi:opacity protein-like surface antigen